MSKILITSEIKKSIVGKAIIYKLNGRLRCAVIRGVNIVLDKPYAIDIDSDAMFETTWLLAYKATFKYYVINIVKKKRGKTPC